MDTHTHTHMYLRIFPNPQMSTRNLEASLTPVDSKLGVTEEGISRGEVSVFQKHTTGGGLSVTFLGMFCHLPPLFVKIKWVTLDFIFHSYQA